MKGYVFLTKDFKPAEVYCYRDIFARVLIDGVSIEAYDPALLDALGAAFIMAATQLADAKAKA